MPDVTITCPDGEFSAYLAMPAGDSGPGVLVIQEIFGVNRGMRAHCDRLAGRGYIALCPDLFWRQAPGIQLDERVDAEKQRAFELFRAFDDGKGVSDLKDSLAYLRDMEGFTGRAGTLGFCLGGKLVYLMACRSDSDCNVSYYGVGLEELVPESPHITTPTILHVAEEDEYCPPDARRRIVDGLAGHPCVNVYTYPGCAHAFAREQGPHFDAEATRLADERTMACFEANLMEA